MVGAVGVLNLLITKLSILIEGKYKLLKGMKKDIIFLRSELSSISVLLEHLSNSEDKLDVQSLQTKEWRNNMLDLAYDIEDCIDLFMHKLSHSDANSSFVRKIGKEIKNLWNKHTITEHIKGGVVEIDPRLLALYKEVDRLVGIDGPRKKTIEWLMNKNRSTELHRKVVSIVGLGGLGKTTLANEVYKTIQGVLSVQLLCPFHVLVDVLKDFRTNGNSSDLEDERQLINRLRGILNDKRGLEIGREDLIWKWIAEGFIVEVKGQTLEQVGENYFNELINRSLIQPIDMMYDGSSHRCRVHDIVLDLIISLSTGQNFVTIQGSCFKKIRRIRFPSDCTKGGIVKEITNNWSHKIRRIRFPSDCTKGGIVKEITNNWSHVRSLIFYHPQADQIPRFGTAMLYGVLFRAAAEGDGDQGRHEGDGEIAGVGANESNLQLGKEAAHPNRYTRAASARSGSPSPLRTRTFCRGSTMRLGESQAGEMVGTPMQAGRTTAEIPRVNPGCVVSNTDTHATDPLHAARSAGGGDWAGAKEAVEMATNLHRLTRLREIGIKCYGICEFGGDVERLQRYKEAFYLTLEELDFIELCIHGEPISNLLKRLVSFYNLAYLDIIITCFDQKVVNLLGDIPKLLNLELFCQRQVDGLTVGRGRFPCLKVLIFSGIGMHSLLFEPLLMPKLQKLYGDLIVWEDLQFEQSLVHLSSLQHLSVNVTCCYANQYKNFVSCSTMMLYYISPYANVPPSSIYPVCRYQPLTK
uniref:Rx N-terminal domain-containing protein n=1 Tax=Leersia perrieri TaxID=77586 RepID=A0A0D9XYD2_9ORYZ